MLSQPFRMLLGLATLALAAGSAAGSAITPRVVHERRAMTPRGWSLQRRADSDLVIPLSFALAQSNVHDLESYLLDIADPASPNYGKHWTPAKVAETFRPSRATVDVVHSWLAVDNGISLDNIQLSRNGDALHVNVTIAEAERILGAEYFVYEHESGRERVGCHRSPTLPEHIAKHVDYVSPGPQPSGTLFAGAVPASTKGKRALNTALAGHESGVQRTPISVSTWQLTAARNHQCRDADMITSSCRPLSLRLQVVTPQLLSIV